MNKDEKKHLDSATERIATLFREKKEIDDEIAEIVAECAEKTGLRKGNIRKAARERNMDELGRADKRLVEEELDQIRSALGILADTPLGEAAADASTKKKGTSKQVKKIAEETGATF